MDCSNLYSPEPDVAGQAVFIAFLTHTSVFVFLALVITPIVQLYIPIVRPEEERQEAGELEHGAWPTELMIPLEARDEPPRINLRESMIRLEARDEPPRLVYRCSCREAVQNAYTSQYIAGIAFVVTAFVKKNSLSYYHLRVIYSLLAMNSVIGAVSTFDRDSRLAYLVGGRYGAKKWKMIDFVYMINVAVFCAFAVYIFIKRDPNFSNCYKNNRPMVFATWFWFGGLCALTVLRWGFFRSAAGWLFFTLAVAGFVGFQSWQIWVLTRTFRKRAVAPGEADESTFTFGQILVLFMIVPLVGDFAAGMMVDLRRMERRSWRDLVISFLNIYRVLIPYFVRQVIEDLQAVGKNVTQSAYIRGPINAIVRFAKNISNSFSQIFKISRSSNRALNRTNTVRLESQENLNPLSSPPSALRRPHSPIRVVPRPEGAGGGGGGGAAAAAAHARHSDEVSSTTDIPENPDNAIPPPPPPLPGSLRPRPSFPYGQSSPL